MARFLPFSPQIIAFFAAVAVYAVLGSPTPDRIGAVEAVIAGLLVVAFWKPAFMTLRRVHFPSVFLVGGLSVPTFVGILYGHPASLILRDVAAFLFLSLPILGQNLWFAHTDETREGRFRYGLCAGFACLGLLFSLRSLLDLHLLAPAPLTYFANMPSVLFTALVCPFLAFYTPTQSWIQPLGLAGLSLLLLLPVMAMGLTLQRAPLAYWGVFTGGLLLMSMRASPQRVLVIAGLIALIGALFYAQLWDVAWALWDKTRVHGGNMRVAEWQAVLATIGDGLPSALFGTGWGGTFSSPAVADIRVNFTHSLLSSLLLKTGLVGFGFAIFYLGWIGQHLVSIFKKDRLVGFMLFGPLFISIFLYASYKSFDFGYLLLLIVVLGRGEVIETERGAR